MCIRKLKISYRSFELGDIVNFTKIIGINEYYYYTESKFNRYLNEGFINRNFKALTEIRKEKLEKLLK